MAKRSSSRIATVAALLALQAPLCALACVAGSEAATAAHDDSADPCHQAPAGSPSDRAPDSHEECGCEPADEALLPDTSGSTATLAQAFVSHSPLSEPAKPGLHRLLDVPGNTDLPPPDIPLLNSAFLI
jgi:hypothetical protein